MIDWLGRSSTNITPARRRGGLPDQLAEWLAKPARWQAAGPTPSNLSTKRERSASGASLARSISRSLPSRLRIFNDRPRPPRRTRELFHARRRGLPRRRRLFFSPGGPPSASFRVGQHLSQEIDNEIIKHPAVEDSCAIGVPNDEWARRSRWWSPSTRARTRATSWAPTSSPSPRRAWPDSKPPAPSPLRGTPRSPAGKIQRGKVRAPYWAGRARQI